MDDIAYQNEDAGHVRPVRGSLWQWILKRFDDLMDSLEEDWAIVLREADLFFGLLLFIVGVLNFQTGKFCDGNAADYLSCTRPAPYYYYSWLEIILIFLGITFIVLWFMKRSSRRHHDY